MTVEQVDAQFKLVEQIHDLRAEIERLCLKLGQAEKMAKLLRDFQAWDKRVKP